MELIIEELKSIRQKHAITMLEISQGCGVTERSVISWLNNNSKPHRQHLLKIEAFVKRTKTKAEADEKREIERCEAIILNEIYNELDYVFFSRPRPGEKFSEGTYPKGVAITDRQLRSFSRACELRPGDPVILKTLDKLASNGQVKILSIFVPARRNFEHMTLSFEIGLAERSIPAQDRNMKITRSFKDRPRTQEEVKTSPGILNIRERVEAIYKRHEDGLKARYGASGIEAEIREHKEKVEDEAVARISQLEASQSLSKITNNKGAKMEGDQRPVSEFTELKTFKKVREFYEEVVENNTDRPAIVYNCNSEKIEIPPHEKRIVLRARMIKPTPKAKEIKVIK